jgi:signal transduction histidine kinase
LPTALAVSVDTGMVAFMRCLLAFAALVVIYLDPAQASPAGLTYALLLLYTAYSAALCLDGVRNWIPSRVQPWIDVVVYTMLVALTKGTGSIFFHFYFFAIVAASFSRGLREGFAVTMVAVLGYAVISLVDYAGSNHLRLGEALTRTVSLYILGYLISYWGQQEIALRRRLSLLRELSAAANPRVGLDDLMAQNLTRLLDFFGAQSCLLVFAKAGASTRLLYRADRGRPFAVFPPDEVSNALAWPLLGLPPDLCFSFDGRPGLLREPTARTLAWLPGAGRHEGGLHAQCAEVAAFLETPSFASVPYRQTEGIAGRLYLTSPSRRFSEQETEFLAQVASHMATGVNNAMLLDELATNAAQQERSKISRDIHDTTVQSYIGLKLGLEALYRDISPASPGASRIKELLDMATLTVDDLRGYVDRLRGRQVTRPAAELLSQLEEQRRRYRDYHGIDVKMNSASTLPVDERVAGEAYQVVCEALSNVFRHTAAKQAFVELRCDAESLAIEVGNDAAPGVATRPFMPRSITERTMALGGRVQVNLNNGGHDVVKVTIPLSERKDGASRPAVLRS